MRLTYETGPATLIQFVVLSFLNIANGLNSVITTCRKQDGTDCVGNIMVSIIFFMLVVGWFAFLWVLGYLAQARRSKRLALVLIGAEALVAMVAYFNIEHYNDHLGLFTSIVDLILALWIILLAVRLMRAKGGRVVIKSRTRRRKT